MGSLLQGRPNLSVLCEPERNVNDGHGDMLCISLTSNGATGSLEGHVVGGNRPEDASAGRRPESTKTPEKEDGEKPPAPQSGEWGAVLVTSGSSRGDYFLHDFNPNCLQQALIYHKEIIKTELQMSVFERSKVFPHFLCISLENPF